MITFSLLFSEAGKSCFTATLCLHTSHSQYSIIPSVVEKSTVRFSVLTLQERAHDYEGGPPRAGFHYTLHTLDSPGPALRQSVVLLVFFKSSVRLTIMATKLIYSGFLIWHLTDDLSP